MSRMKSAAYKMAQSYIRSPIQNGKSTGVPCSASGGFRVALSKVNQSEMVGSTGATLACLLSRRALMASYTIGMTEIRMMTSTTSEK